MKTKITLQSRAGFRITRALFVACTLLLSALPSAAQSTNPSPYCSVSHTNMSNNGCQGNWGFYITKVELNGAVSNHSCDNGTVYRYYNNTPLTSLKRGQTYTIYVQTASTVYNTSSGVWIDFNGNTSFGDAGEFIGASLGGNAPNLSYTFTVPGNATPGVTRMRVRCDYDITLSSGMYCGATTYEYGETIDFDIEIEQATYPDVSLGNMEKPASVCGDNIDSVVVSVYNFGNTNVSNIPVTCEITGTMGGNAVNQTFNTTITSTINMMDQYRLAFPASINTNNNGTLNFKIYTALATDGDLTNDTLKISKTFYGTPADPTVSDVDRCGVGTVTLNSTPQSMLDNVRWYSAASGGTMIGAGSSITSPFYHNTTTVYAQASRNGASASFAPSTTGNTVYWGGTTNEQGGMMDVTPTKTMMINNIQIRKFYGFVANYKVFIRVGGYSGYETDPTAWTLVGTANNVGGGSGTMVPINIGGFILEEGVTYGIYVQCLGDDFWIRYNPSPPFYESNDDMVLQNGIYLYGNFSNTVYWYCIDVQFDYTTMCLGNRVPVDVTIKPVPNGTTLAKGSVFNGQFASGNAQDPDITSDGDVIIYDLMPPTGYQNSGFGSTWGINLLTLKTPNGTDLPPSAYNIINPGAGNGRIEITPPIGFADSTIIGTVSVTANGCDTILKRTFFIAPRPNIGFTANPSCEGEGMQFSNHTTIASGSISYLWDFGDGNTSVLINPNHAYTAAGTYDVTLVATSNYGYTEQTTVQVTVYENPTAEFTYQNVCEGTAAPFMDASVIPAGTPTYEWNFGDGSAMGSGANPTHLYAATGVYEVTMKVTANGCSDETSNYVTYAPRAVPDFSTSVVDCNNDPVSFTNASSLSSGQMGYSWDFGDNTTSTSINPTHQYTAFGTINITLTVTTDFGCVDMVSKQITLTEAPMADFSSSMLCDKDNADFLNLSSEPSTGGATSYEWWFSDGSTYTTKDVNRGFSSVGEYTVKLKAIAGNGCIDEVTKTISVDEEPSALFYADDVCEGADVAFRNASTGNMGNYTSSWDFGGGNTSTDKNPEVSLGVGTHTVTLTVSTPSGCESDITKTVTVIANPVINSLDVSSGQSGDGTMNLIASVSPATVDYVIFWGDGGHESGNTTTGQVLGSYTYLIDGKYPVQLTIMNGACMTKDDQMASVLRTGVINLKAGDLKVYPNPGNGRFYLDLSGLNGEVVSIAVTSVNGQVINGNPVIEGEAARLDLSGVAAGVYLVTVTTENGVYTARLTVNN